VSPEEFYKIYLRHPQISTDSRKITPGCLYFALKGEHFDGNRFAADALEKGCAYVVVDDQEAPADDRFIRVPDVLAFLQDLAALHRSGLDIPVIGLTGTNGKTTTKELILSVLKQKFNTVATEGNLNNHIGVPLTLLAANGDTRILIVEMGANHVGEIDFLSALARPSIGLITNIGKAHLEGFGSFEGVVKAKNELYDRIRKSGQLIVRNQDDILLTELAGDFPSLTYGTAPESDITGRMEREAQYITLEWSAGSSGPHRIQSLLTGGYNFYNLLAAVAMGVRFGLDPGEIRQGIESYVPGNMRSQWITTDRNRIFLDAYNANPSSMEVALTQFAGLGLDRPGAILGDMFELGAYSAEEHLNVLRMVEKLQLAPVLVAGPRFSEHSTDFPFRFFGDVADLIGYLKAEPVSGHQLIIKGSRGMQLEQVVGYL
jgi:UDP-N-acetylmuramoyl-tripeptide--D-alanyl-D-alanine ligase